MKKRSKEGFTLVEVLVAMAVFMVIVFPFLSAYVLSNKINQEAFYIKRATDALEIAQEDIRTWDEDILEVMSGKQWKYLNTKEGTSMHAALRKLLDDNTVTDININGVPWGDGMDIFFEVTKSTKDNSDNVLKETAQIDSNEADNLRSGYDLYVKVTKEGMTITPKGDTNGTVLKNNNVNNNGKGYYLNVTLGSNSSYKITKVPSDYTPLEKVAGNNKILFGGQEWKTLFNKNSGDVAVMYVPKSDSNYMRFPFDTSGMANPRYKQTAGANSWQNIASYLNNEFYNSLTYSQYLNGENYYTNRNWIKKHRWNIGTYGNEVSETTLENVGLLAKNEIDKIVLTDGRYNTDAYTLTPSGNTIYLISGSMVSPTTTHYIYPVIYLDGDLYCKTSDTSGYRLYEVQNEKFGTVLNGGETLVGQRTVSGSQVKIMINFDKDLGETNFEGELYEKLRLLVNVVDNRSTKTPDGLIIYTINNKDMGNYKWLNIHNANKTTDFKTVDSIYLEEDYKNNSSTTTELLRKFKVNGYKIKVWAEYMATDEYRGNNEYKNEHESLTLYINKEKDVPTFDYKVSGGTYKEGDNIKTVNLESTTNRKYRR